MKNSSLLLLFTIFVIAGQSQDFNISWGQKYKEEKGEDLKNIIYDDGQNVYGSIILNQKKYVIPGIIKLDNNLTEVKRVDINTAVENAYFLGIEYLGGKFISLSSTYDKNINSSELIASIIDKDLNISKKDIKIWSANDNKNESFDFSFKFSEDTSKLLVYINPSQPKDQNERFAFAIFDKDLNKISEKEIRFPFTEKEFNLLDVCVTNNGDVYAFAKKYSGKKEKVKNAEGKAVAGYLLTLYRYAQDGTENEYNINLEDKFLVYDRNKGKDLGLYRSAFPIINSPHYVSNMTNKVIHGNSYILESDKNGDLYFIAFYENDFEKGINGFVYYKIDNKTGNVISNYNWKVPTTLSMRLKTMENENNKSKEPAIGREFTFSDFIILDDKIFVIAEKNYAGVISRANVHGSSTGVSANYYFSLGMIVFELEKTGRVKWYSYVPKYQLNPNFTYYQYHTTFIKDGKLNIFYNDEPKNADFFVNSPKPPQVFNNEIKMQFIKVSFDEKGKAERKVIGDNEQMETNIVILKSHQTKYDRFFLYGYQWRTKENKLGLVNF